MSVSQVLGNQHGVTVAAWCIVMSLVMRMVQPSGDSRLCGTSLDLGDEGLEDEPARSATSRVGHSIIGGNRRLGGKCHHLGAHARVYTITIIARVALRV